VSKTKKTNMFKGKSILITGGTGSFGHAFVPMTLEKYNPKKIVILSRDEMKQWEMAKLFKDDSRVRFMIGDVRDKDRLYRALDGIDYVVHAAATKIVPTAEYDPFECVKTNVLGAMNLIDACIDKGVKRIIALSTDKASSPANLYGATKLTSDRLFVSGNSYTGSHNTSFSVVRYGNVMGSRGSVIPFFMSIDKAGTLPITDNRMTRFMISLEDAVELIWHAFEDMIGGEIYVKKIPSMKVTDVALAVNKNAKQEEVGIRPGEKLHEQMIGEQDVNYTYEYPEHFKILPSINDWSKDAKRIGNGVKVDSDFTYSSDSNKEWMKISELQDWIEKNRNKIGNI
jgi:UDP-N-acetylglucosamine 4,6-dehydratase/5-epimerase